MRHLIWVLLLLGGSAAAGEILPEAGRVEEFLDLLRRVSPLPGDLLARDAPSTAPLEPGFEAGAEHPLELLLGKKERLYLGGGSGPTITLTGPRGTILAPTPAVPDPKFAPAWELVLQAVREKDVERPEVAAALETVLADPELSGDPRAWYLAGLARFQSGALDEAAAAFLRAAELNQTDPHALFLAAVSRVQARKPKLAIEPLQEALKRAPESATATGLLGEVHARIGAHRDAVRYLGPAVGAASSPPLWRLLLARSLLRLGAPAKAWEQIEALSPTVRESIRAKLLSARVQLACGKPKESLALSRQILDEREQFVLAWSACFEAELRLGLYEEAERSVSRLRELRPEVPHYTAAEGRLRLIQGRHEVAVRCFREALGAGYKAAWVHRLLGDSQKALGRRAEAIKAYEAFLAQRPEGKNAEAVRKALGELR